MKDSPRSTSHPLNQSLHPTMRSSCDDSQQDVPTAVGTPVVLTPNTSKRDLRGSALDDSDNEKLDRDQLSPLRSLSSALNSGSGEPLKRGRSRRLSAAENTQLEAVLRAITRESGTNAHRGENGVIEKRVMVDMGNGPEEVTLVDWLPDDPENPFNWSPVRKYATVIVAVFITALTAGNATSTGVMSTWGTEWYNTSREGFEVGLTMYMVAVAFTPLVLAPMSEVFGRNAIYQVTSVINALLFLPQILSHNYSGYLAARWFQGMVSSVGNSMVGGTVADVFYANNRGIAMNCFSLLIFIGQAFGSATMGWVGMRLGFQWCYGIQGIAAGVSIIFNALVLRETRADVLLSRRAKKLTKLTGTKHMCAAELQKKSIATLLSVSIVRPLQYLVTEPIVTALSIWIGFAWACIFLGTSSTILVFEQYGWNIGQCGTIGVTVAIGGFLGFVSNYHQEYLYRKAIAHSNTGKAAPEARLYWAAFGGSLFPLSMYVFAWTGQPQIHWVVPAICLTFCYWGVYCMYSGVFNYLADAYETYSSSAQAAQSFARNFLSGIFPLFARQMYTAMGYPQASTLIAAISTVLAAAPFLLIVYGARLRARSKVASALSSGQ